MLEFALALTLLTPASEDPRPDPPRILVMRWSVASGADLDASELLDDLLSTEVADAQPESAVVGMAEMEALLNVEQAKDLIGCDDVSCTAEIGLALDADLLVQGSLGRIDERTFVVLKLIDTRDATVASRADGSTNQADVTGVIKKLVLQLFGLHSARAYTTLPGTPYDQWLARVESLAYDPLHCAPSASCLRIARSRIERIEFLLSKDDWPAQLEPHRDALLTQLTRLHRLADQWSSRLATHTRADEPPRHPSTTRTRVVVVETARSAQSARSVAEPRRERVTPARPAAARFRVVRPALPAAARWQAAVPKPPAISTITARRTPTARSIPRRSATPRSVNRVTSPSPRPAFQAAARSRTTSRVRTAKQAAVAQRSTARPSAWARAAAAPTTARATTPTSPRRTTSRSTATRGAKRAARTDGGRATARK